MTGSSGDQPLEETGKSVKIRHCPAAVMSRHDALLQSMCSPVCLSLRRRPSLMTLSSFPCIRWRRPTLLLSLTAITAVVLHPNPGLAHHLLDISNLTPNAFNGFVSGLAHPLIGPDHLLFLLALTLVGFRHSGPWMLALLVVGLAGSGLGLVLPGLPAAELMVSATLAVEALVLLRRLPVALLVPCMALHGYVLSDAVLGWSAMPIGTYLLGLLLSQGLMLLTGLVLLGPASARISSLGRQRLAMLLLASSLALGLATQLA